MLCGQEFFEKDLEILKNRFGYNALFLPMCKRWYGKDNTPPIETEGIAILTKLPIIKSDNIYYHLASPQIELYEEKRIDIKRKTIRYGLLWGTFQYNETEFTIGTTHFTWTPDGMPNEYQETDIKALMEILEKIPDLILCGDFNIPRNINHLYGVLAKKFKDNMPHKITTTLDMSMHKIRTNPTESKRVGTYVVDYIFSTPKYNVSNVRCEYGVSDHAAVIADISKT